MYGSEIELADWVILRFDPYFKQKKLPLSSKVIVVGLSRLSDNAEGNLEDSDLTPASFET
jgi:hypothetical protein